MQDAVAKVADRIEIEDVRLRYMTAVVGAPSPAELPPEWVEDISAKVEGHAVLGDIEEQTAVAADLIDFVASVTFRIEYWVPERTPSEDELPDVGLFAAFDLVYDLKSPEGLTIGDLQKFARVNAVFNAWPYWRELVHSTTRRMGFTAPLVVGVLTASALASSD